MATDDCYEIGSGPCPCGKGAITVERCTPDHPWAKASQAWYRNRLSCSECKDIYGFFEISHGDPARLVLKSDLKETDVARKSWYETLREIESLPSFKQLADKLEASLAQQKSAAARHWLLIKARLSAGSLPSYRKTGYKLRAGDAKNALTFFGLHYPDLETKLGEAEDLWKQVRKTPLGIKTGIKGLEM